MLRGRQPMKRKLVTLLLVPAMVLVAGAFSVIAGQSNASAGGTPTMPLSEIKPGQIGVVHTVFQGTKIEQFECEVLTIMKDAIGPHKDLILVRLRGQKPEFTGVVAGMSGSPVYINGRLIGALAYRFGIFTKEPIAGITPIEYMLEADKYNGAAVQGSANTGSWNLDSTGVATLASAVSQAPAVSQAAM